MVKWAGGTVWSVRLLVTEKVTGSNPVRPARNKKLIIFEWVFITQSIKYMAM